MMPMIGMPIVPTSNPAFAKADGMANIPVPMFPFSKCIMVCEFEVSAPELGPVMAANFFWNLKMKRVNKWMQQLVRWSCSKSRKEQCPRNWSVPMRRNLVVVHGSCLLSCPNFHNFHYCWLLHNRSDWVEVASILRASGKWTPLSMGPFRRTFEGSWASLRFFKWPNLFLQGGSNQKIVRTYQLIRVWVEIRFVSKCALSLTRPVLKLQGRSVCLTISEMNWLQLHFQLQFNKLYIKMPSQR